VFDIHNPQGCRRDTQKDPAGVDWQLLVAQNVAAIRSVKMLHDQASKLLACQSPIRPARLIS